MVDFKKIDASNLPEDWERWAKEADQKGNKDGKYLNSAFEFNYVKDKAYNAVQTGKMDKGQYGSVFGSMNSQQAWTAEEYAKIMQGKDIQDSITPAKKSDRKDKQGTVLDRIGENAATYYSPNPKTNRSINDPIDWRKAAADMKQEFKSSSAANPEYYAKLCAEVDKVADAMVPAKYNSRQDISNIYNTVKDLVLDKDPDPEFKDFRKDVLKQFVKIAESHQQAKEKAQLEARYNDLVTNGITVQSQTSDPVNNPGATYTKHLSRSEVVEQLEKEFKDKGSYLDSYFNIDASEKIDKTRNEMYKHKGLIKELEASKVQAAAGKLVTRTILSLRKPTPDEVKDNPKLQQEYDAMIKKYGLEKFDLTDGKDIEKAAKKILEQEKQADKYTDEAFSGKGTRLGERSQVKGIRQWIAAQNRVNGIKAKAHSEAGLKDAVKDGKVIEKLIADGKLISGKGNDQYDISKLSDLIRDVISPADYRANHQTKNLSEYSEIDNVIREIKKKTGVEVSEKDAKNLIDYCGFDRDTKNIFVSLAKGALAGIIPGLVNFGTSQILQSFMKDVDLSEANERLLNYVVPVTTNIGATHFSSTLDFAFKTTVNGQVVDEADVEVTQKSINAQNRKWRTQFKNIVDENGNYCGPKMSLVKGDDGQFRIKIDGDVTTAQSYTTPVKMSQLLGEDFDLKELGIEEKESKPWRDFAWIMGMNMAMAALQEAFAEMPGEDPVIAWEVAAKDYTEYVNDLQSNKQLSPKMKEAVALMADSFRDADGKWLPQEFEAYLKQCAGGGKSSEDGRSLRTGFVNVHELYNATMARLNNVKLVPKPEKKPEPNPTTKTIVQDTTKTIVVDPTKPTPVKENYAAIKDDDNISGKHTSWEIITKEVYGDQFPKDQKLRTRMYKVMQGMNEEKLTLEQLQELAEISMKKIRNVKTFTDLNGKTYMDPADYAKKAKEAFKDVEFLKDYNFNYETFAENVCRGTIGDKDGMLILPEVLYSVKTKEDGSKVTTKITRQKTPSPAPRKKSNGKGGGRTIPKRGTAGTVGEGKVKEGDNETRRTSKREAKGKIDGGYKPKKYDEI